MFRRSLTRIFCLLLMIATLLAGSQFGFAARKPIPSRKTTDAAGRTHVRPAGKISDAQRRAAARQRKAVRERSMQSVNNGGRR